jgi:hypothetical protein
MVGTSQPARCAADHRERRQEYQNGVTNPVILLALRRLEAPLARSAKMKFF